MRLWYPLHHRLRYVLWGLLGIQFLLVAILILLAVGLQKTQSDIESANDRKTSCDQKAGELRQLVSELIQNAQTDVVPGDENFKSRFDETKGALEFLYDLLDANLYDRKASDKFIRAKVAVDDIEGQFNAETKNKFKESIEEFVSMTSSRVDSEVASLKETEGTLFIINFIVLSILVLSTFVSVTLAKKHVLQPIKKLTKTARRVSSDDYSARADIAGQSELAAFGRTFDKMVASVEKNQKEEKAARKKISEQAYELEKQRDENERLLLNMLPRTIAERLKEGEKPIADSFSEVTVIFSDIVGFTEMSAHIGAKQIVDILNDIFGEFDDLAIRHKLEKIKTIGDCYMAVAGVPDRSPTHAQQIADFALDMNEFISQYSAETGHNILMRTGINSGTVVAGIVGNSKFAYDLWGDVVNVASRMESTGQPGLIQVSEAVRFRLQDDYAFESRGGVEIKGKGVMETWYLTEKLDQDRV